MAAKTKVQTPIYQRIEASLSDSGKGTVFVFPNWGNNKLKFWIENNIFIFLLCFDDTNIIYMKSKMYIEEIKVRKEKITSGTNRSSRLRNILVLTLQLCSPYAMTQTPRTVIKEATNL